MIDIIAQLLGYFAFIFLAVSLWLTNDIKFRWINSLGCLAFILYGILINAFPIVLTNAALLAINIYFLYKIYNRQEKFELVEFTKDSVLVPKFLSFYKKDIQEYFPEFSLTGSDNDLKFVVLRDIVIANIFVLKTDGDGNAFVNINYTVPKYRDYKVGRFLFEEGRDYMKNKGIRKIIYTYVHNKKHERFLRIIGFKHEKVGDRICLVKDL